VPDATASASDRTVWLIFAAKAVRTYCYGFLGVVLPVHLSRLGLGADGVGAAVTLTLVASAALTLLTRRPAERLGSRTVLIGLSGFIVASGTLFATTAEPTLAVAAAMIGNLAVGAGETGPFLSLEQVLVARAVAGPRLTLRMSLYNLVGYAAAGLGALTVTALVPHGEDFTPLFWLFAAGGAGQLVAYRALDPPTAAAAAGRRAAAVPRPSRRFVYRLAALFALDSLAGGFVVQSLIAYWLFVRFGLAPGALGTIFFGAQAMTVASLLIAAPVAARVGLVNTMVFSHLVSNVFLVALAFAPDVRVAVGLLLGRALLSQIDVPTRQAFLMSVVADQEREGAAAVTNAARTVAQSLTPALTGPVVQALGLGAPFVLGGSLKIVYDLLLYALCRRRGGQALSRPGPASAGGRRGRERPR
jgi:MFS family permease